MRRYILGVPLLILFLALPSFAGASNIYIPRHNKKCHKGYRNAKRKQHGTLIRVCVKRPKVPKVVTKKLLHAHLDPTYTRDPLNPFRVKYDYSASATQTSEIARSSEARISEVEETAQLPTGVLALYSDGKLECAINVGEGVTGSVCPVNYEVLGAHNVTTIYTSGTQSATATETEVIEPIPTTTHVGIGFVPNEEEGSYLLGVITVTYEVAPFGPNVLPAGFNISVPTVQWIGEGAMVQIPNSPITLNVRKEQCPYDPAEAPAACVGLEYNGHLFEAEPPAFFNRTGQKVIASETPGDGYTGSQESVALDLGLSEE